jgi:hypothetical protein
VRKYGAGKMLQEKIESYLINLSLTYERKGENLWVIRDEEEGLENVVIFVEDSLLTIRVKVMEIPEEGSEKLFEELLQLNADMIHGAYAIEDASVIIIDTLEVETMDFEELQASLDAVGLALAQHYTQLSKYRN